MAETTTISNLPQITIDELTNDTLVPVENVDGTKAANLAQLRKKLNSLYVEMVDADLNELKQDGIYECWGTTLNAPTSEVSAWIIQTAEHDGVVVQNAFGLGTTSYSYVYRRRWDGVSWTAWENKIQTLETVKANVDLSNLSAEGQAKFDAKANTDASNFTATGKQNIVGFVMVDYTTGIDVPLTGINTFTAPYDCEVYYRSGLRNGAQEFLSINGLVFAIQEGPFGGFVRSTVVFKMSKGDVLRGLAQNDDNRNSGLSYYRLKGR